MEKTDEDLQQRPFSKKEMQSNFSALLFLLTEQQALIGGLLQELMNNGLLSLAQIERITDVRNETGKMDALYLDIYNRFVEHFRKTAVILEAHEQLREKLEKQKKEEEEKEDE